MMKKVIFFYEDAWAFGSIFHAVNKELFKYGMYGTLVNWSIGYSASDMAFLNDTHDVFITSQYGTPTLVDIYGIPKSKIIVYAHCDNDMYINTWVDREHIHEYGGFAVISEQMIPTAKELRYSKIPDVVKTGIHTELYNTQLPTELSTVGYATGLMSHHYHGFDKKRGQLVKDICNRTGLRYKSTTPGKTINLAIPGYYQSVDAVIMSSFLEMGGLPMLEAAAAGRLCIGTPTGYFKDHAENGGGILMPMEESAFVEESSRVIDYYKCNPSKFVEKCASIQQYAKDNYDWKYMISDWINLINKV